MIKLGHDINENEVNIEIGDFCHLLIAGLTRQGKTVLAKSILYQLQKIHKFQIYIIDGKDGLDFNKQYREHCKLALTLETQVKLMEFITAEYKSRAEYLSDLGYENVNRYNKTATTKIQKICVYIDETIDILERKGKSKADKELIEKLDARLCEMARKGASMGIHLIFATQKPDANVLSSQIKTNCGTRFCTRVNDMATSFQVLGSGIATNIPKRPGIFAMVHNGEEYLFQSYDFDSNDMKLVSYGFNTFVNYDLFMGNKENREAEKLEKEITQKKEDNIIIEPTKENIEIKNIDSIEKIIPENAIKGVEKLEIILYIKCLNEEQKKGNKSLGYKTLSKLTNIKENKCRKINAFLIDNKIFLSNKNTGKKKN